jgi:hypothetical protein
MGTYYRNIEPFLDQIDSGIWIEIGVDRGEGSTKYFSDLAKQYATKFYAVDYDSEQIQRITNTLAATGNAIIAMDGTISYELGALPDHVAVVQAKGEDFLSNYKIADSTNKVSLVYLDNFDWNYWVGRQEESFVPAQKQHYLQTMGIEMNNLNSQQTHLLQAIYLMTMMADNSIIVCDDTWYHPEEGVFIGKCSAVIPYLLLNGYQVLHYQGYRQNSGAILGRFNNKYSTQSH